MDELPLVYVRLVLALGVHDPDAVDAYYGPPDLQAEATAAARPLADVTRDIAALRASLDALAMPTLPDAAWRLEMLRAQARALATRAAIRGGQRVSFDEESAALYDAVAPTHTEEYFASSLPSVILLVLSEAVDPVAQHVPAAGTNVAVAVIEYLNG
jgi:hypothetical protein